MHKSSAFRLLSIVFFLNVVFDQPARPTLADGIAKLQANDFKSAAVILEQVTAREPNNGLAWRNLALARQNLKQWNGAVAADQRALEVEPSVPTPMFHLGLVYALEGDREQAFAWLNKAKVTHKIDMSQLEVRTELDPLRSDPRYQPLLPTRADFDNPFVEDVKIIREWDGEATNDQFGWIARNIGDVDGDGVPDVVISAPSSHVGGVDAGRIYVYSTKSGKLLWTADGHPNDQLGTGVEAAGDTNGDGIPDVIASAPGGGYVNIYSGRDGRVLQTLRAEQVDDQFGRHASGAGDVNHDGFADVIVRSEEH